MAQEFIQLGATELIQLGALELIELGQAHTMGATDIETSPVIQMFRMVEFMEDPLSDVELQEDEEMIPQAKAIAERLRTASRSARKALRPTLGSSMGSFDDIMAGIVADRRLLEAAILSGSDLGKSFRKRIKKVVKKVQKTASAVGKKVVKVVKSPAFLTVAGVAAGFIPGVGAVAGPALLAAASARAAYVKKVKEAKGESMSWDEVLGEQLAPVVATVQAAGMFGLMPDKEGAQQLTDSMPEGVQQQAAGLVPGIASQIQQVGPENFIATALKALGQSSAISDLFKGTGSSLPSGLSDIFARFTGGDADKAKRAGEEDLKNSAAATGEGGVVDTALDRGAPSEFPWVPVLVTGGVVTTVGVIALAGGFSR
jgi:hypothetical protein